MKAYHFQAGFICNIIYTSITRPVWIKSRPWGIWICLPSDVPEKKSCPSKVRWSSEKRLLRGKPRSKPRKKRRIPKNEATWYPWDPCIGSDLSIPCIYIWYSIHYTEIYRVCISWVVPLSSNSGKLKNLLNMWKMLMMTGILGGGTIQCNQCISWWSSLGTWVWHLIAGATYKALKSYCI